MPCYRLSKDLFSRLISCSIACLLSCGSLAAQTADRPAGPVPLRSVAEFALHYDARLENPFMEIEAGAVFSGPDGRASKVEGFYDGEGTWRFRFVPRIPGPWKAALRLIRGGETVASREESFLCSPGNNRGFLELSPANCYRLRYEDGTPFYPVGIQTCGETEAGLDGPPRGEGKWRTVPMEEYLQAYEGAANLCRIQLGAGTRNGCAWEVITDPPGLYRYDLEICRRLDELYRLLSRHGFSTILIPFQDMSLWGTDSTSFGSTHDLEGWKNIHNSEAVRPVRHYLRYLVARYAAFTDIWELFNEDAFTPDEWLSAMAAYVDSLDPYGHLLTTNYERPLAAWCDLVTPHEYMWMPAREVDAHLAKEFARLKSFGEPVLYTEFGNQGGLSNRDPVKWRIAVWTAFMNESAILFWSMGGILVPEVENPKGGGNANAYLGPEARAYFRNFLSFVRDLPLDLRPVMVGYGERGDELRRYALSNGRLTLLYLQHFTGHESAAQGDVYVWTGPGSFEIEWYDPASGRVASTQKEKTEGNVLIFRSAPVTSDLAARIRREQ